MQNPYEILVIDDNPTNLEVIIETLSSEDYVVSATISGERALKRLEMRSHVPDLILLDIQMPGLDGFETCRQLKGNPKTASIPIIFITAAADAESIAKGFAVGAIDYISKPFQEVELLARVKTHLELKALNQSLECQVAERTHALGMAMAQRQDILSALKSSQLQIIQQEKLSALGNLVAGVAHEINNPIGFVAGNVEELQTAMQDLAAYIECFEHTFPSPGDELTKKRDALDIDFLLKDIPEMLTSMEMGCQRISSISNSLRLFARADSDSMIEANIHDCIDSTLLILKYRLQANEVRPDIHVTCDYGELPEIACFPGQLSQVFMNILANAIDMFDEITEGQSFEALEENPPKITIHTQLTDSQQVDIRIQDNGKGMPEEICAKIFERQFTTKTVGKGTGLGLAIAQQIVTEAHSGYLNVHSKPGQGSEFHISLPLTSEQ